MVLVRGDSFAFLSMNFQPGKGTLERDWRVLGSGGTDTTRVRCGEGMERH